MLRLSAQVFAVWLIAVFTLLAMWFVGGQGRTGSSARRGRHADAQYLASLSADAVPTVVTRLSNLPPPRADAYREAVCQLPHRHAGWASFNVASRRGRRSLAAIC
jgi:hypothetical protein